ncbi:MAG: hypothetical protein BMS9Abin20_0969 [Acidimicrobiia bacterium]|nr:MAG: hypothetical protein BMS9Abin20_0969 [Acidimicrobiia bacterium]
MAVEIFSISIEGEPVSDRTRQQIELIYEELAEVALQVRDGDLDEATAAEVQERYRAELADLEASLESAETPSPDDETEPEPAGVRRRLNGRALVGVALVAVAITVIGVYAVQSLTDRRVAGAEGVVGDVVTGANQIDLDKVTNEEMEAVVAANPDIIPMRLALARRYFEAGEFDKALDHYFEVLNRERNPEALANVGWMTYLSGRPDVAVGYVEAALEREPDYLAAEWFLGNIYVSLGRNTEAVVPLTKIASSNDVPDDVQKAAVTLLVQIEADG